VAARTKESAEAAPAARVAELRAALDEAQCANLMGEVQREKSMLL